MKKAVLYARVSSDLQRKERTIDSQIIALKKQIAAAGDILVKEYVDNGYSGARLDRPALDQLRKDLKTNLFETIYFLNSDRIARDVTYQNLIIAEILKSRKQIIINGKDYVHNPENKFTLTVLGAVAELERAKIIERVSRGKQLRLAQGELLGSGVHTFGYNFMRRTPTSPAKMTVNKVEAKIVRYIFTRYAKGNCGMNQISRALEDMGALTKTGKRLWNYTKLHSILRNPTYTGVKYFNKSRTVREYADPIAGRTSSRKTQVGRERKDWVGIPVPAIISQALFDRVQERLEWNRKHYRNPGQVQLLSSLVRCGQCGSSFFAYQRHFRDRRRQPAKKVYHKVAYRCSWRIRQYAHSAKSDIRRCATREIKAQYLEDQVFALVRAFMFNPEKIRRCMVFFKGRTKTAQGRLERELRSIEARIQLVGEQKRRIIEVYALGDLSKDAYTRKSLGYDNDILKLKKQRSDILKRIPLLHKTDLIDASIREYCETAEARFRGCVDFETRRQFLIDFVEKVEFSNDRLAVYGAVPVKVKQEYEESEHIIDAETNKLAFCIESTTVRRVSVSVA